MTLTQLENHEPDVVFQQNGTPSHWARIILDCLYMDFPGSWVGCDGSVPWSLRSPDITSFDFALWGYPKNIVYKTAVSFVDEVILIIVLLRSKQLHRKMSVNTWRETEYGLKISRATKAVYVEAVQHFVELISEGNRTS